MGRTFQQIYIHLVWTTKNHIRYLHRPLKFKVCKFIKKHGSENGIHVDMINGVEDHVHCLVSMDTTQSVDGIMQILKGASSHFVNENKLTESQFIWQEGYGAFSVSPQNLQGVREYIKKQEAHHLKVSFDEEMKFFQSKFKSIKKSSD